MIATTVKTNGDAARMTALMSERVMGEKNARQSTSTIVESGHPVVRRPSRNPGEILARRSFPASNIEPTAALFKLPRTASSIDWTRCLDDIRS